MIKATFHHLCIQTADYPASLHFYTTILGAKIVKETPNFHSRAFNTWLELGNFMIELQTPKAGQTLIRFDKTSASLVHFCLLVTDVHQAVATIQANNYQNFQTKNNQIIYNVEGSALAKLIAPEGTIIELRDLAAI